MATVEAAGRRGAAIPWFPFLPLALLLLPGADPRALQWLCLGGIVALLALGVGLSLIHI